MIIDANVHITPDGKWFHTPHDASLNELLRQMDEASIDKSVLVPFDGIIHDDFITKVVTKHSDRFIQATSFNPHNYPDAKKAIDGFKLKIEGSDIKIIKFHNRLHHYQPDSNLLDEVLTYNDQINSPKIIYLCGLLFSSKVNSFSISPPNFFHGLAVNFPNTKFVIMHAGGTWALQVSEAIRDCSNVFLDLSMTSKYKTSSVWMDLKYLVHNFDKRIIWGSDFPEFNIKNCLADFNELAKGLDNIKKENILSKNLLNLLA